MPMNPDGVCRRPRPSRNVAALVAVWLTAACTAVGQYRAPVGQDTGTLQARAIAESGDGLAVRAAVPSVTEAAALFGVDLSEKGIQPIWLQIANTADRPFVFLPTGLDPEYFAPLEVAFLFRAGLDRDGYDALAEHLQALSLDSRRLIEPGQTVTGFVHTSAGAPVAIANVVVVGDQWSERVELFLSVPGAEAANRRWADLTRRLEATPVRDLATAAELREVLADLPCCVVFEGGNDAGPPLNLVLIGELDDVAAAFALRGYHYREPGEGRVGGREADLAAMKTSRWRAPKPLVVRVWTTPLRFRGKLVLIGQIGEAEGGRFAVGGPDADAIHHRTDSARDALIQDLAYSQSVQQVGFVTGAGVPSPPTVYATDGLRAVLVFDPEPRSLAEIEFFDWERPAGYR